MYFPDLTPCTYFSPWKGIMTAVGWLEPAHPYSTGVVPENVKQGLLESLCSAVQVRSLAFIPGSRPGYHMCGFCQKEGIPFENVVKLGKRDIELGLRNIFIPAADANVYAAPSTIIHYINVHNYYPPPEFQIAILQGPRMRSSEYYRQMKARGAEIWSWKTLFKRLRISF